MKQYLWLLTISLFMMSCGVKTEITQPQSTISETKEVAKALTTTQKEPKLPVGFVEEKKLQPITANVPPSCQEWSDGCNSCTRTNNNQANCTIYTCENKGPFSCLRWQ